MLVDHAPGKEAEPRLQQHSGLVRVIDHTIGRGFQRCAAGNHHIGHDGGASTRPGDKRTVALRLADRFQHPAFRAAGCQRPGDQGLVAAGEIDAAIVRDEIGDRLVLRALARPGAVHPGQDGIEAMGAKHLNGFGADLVRHRRRRREDDDPATRQTAHLVIDGGIVVLQPAADDGQFRDDTRPDERMRFCHVSL